MGQYEIEIGGFDGAQPLRFFAESKDAVSQLIESCRVDIAIIDREIREFSIPFATSIPKAVHTTKHEVRLISGTMAGRREARDRVPNTRSAGHPETQVAPLRFRRAVEAIAAVIAAVKVSRPGTIVLVRPGRDSDTWSRIYGRLTRTLTQLAFRLIGRNFVRLESGYGSRSSWTVPGIVRRASEHSVLGWLSVDPVVRLQSAGALIFPDLATAKQDLGSLAGLDQHVPPVVFFTDEPEAAHRGLITVPAGAAWTNVPQPAAGPPPKISIVTVSFNQAQYLETAIRSVLDQNYPNLEYILIDGGSTDGSLEIIDKYRSRISHVIVEPDGGQSDALNKGFRLATGEIMNWLCSDDLFEPGSFNRVAEIYQRFGPDLIVGGCVRIGETRQAEIRRHHTALCFGRVVPLPFGDMLRFMRSWHKSNYFYQPEVFFSRHAWEASGAFIKPHLYYAMDYDLWLRMAMAGATVMHVPDMIGASREHGSQKTRGDDRLYLHQVRQVMEEYLQLLVRILEQLEGPESRLRRS